MQTSPPSTSSAALDVDLPLTFRDDPLGGVLLGAGESATSAATALVALPDGATWSKSAHADFNRIGAVSVGPATLPLFRLAHGDVEATVAGEAYSVRTGVDDASTSSFRLEGPRLTLAGEDDAARLGPPRIVELLDDGEALPADAQWRRVGGHTWRPLDDEAACVGDVVLRVVDAAGRGRFRTRCTVLPRRTTYAVRTADDRAGAELHLDGLNVEEAVVELAQLGDTQFDVSVRGGNVILHASGDGRDRSTVLTLRWPGGASSKLRVRSPLPIHGFRRGNTSTGDFAYLPVGELAAITAEFSGTPTGRPMLMYKKPDPTNLRLQPSPHRPLFPLREPDPGDDTWYLPLREIVKEIEALLAETPQVLLFVNPDYGNDQRVARPASGTLSVSRLAGRMFVNDVFASDDEGAAKVAVELSVVGVDCEDGVRIECRPLAEPEEEPKVPPMSRVELGDGRVECRWRLEMNGLAPGGWLATAWRGDEMLARPRFVLVPGPTQTTPLSRLMDPASRHDRANAWERALADIVADLDHPAWDPLRSMAAAAVPSEWFDPLRAAAKVPAAATLLVAMSSRPRRCLTELGRLEMVWTLVPLADWESAVRRVAGRWAEEARAGGVEDVDAYVRMRVDLLLDAMVEFDDALLIAACRSRDALPNSWRPTAAKFQLSGHKNLTQAQALTFFSLHWQQTAPPAGSMTPLMELPADDLTRESAFVREFCIHAIHRTHGSDGSIWHEPEQLAVVPTLAAARAAGEGGQNLDVARVKLVRAASPDWYTEAYCLALAHLLSPRQGVA